jgi:hypothetical protein
MRALGALFLLAPLSIAGSALARPDELTCADFQHNPDGSWSPLKAMTITAPNGQIQAGPGVSFTAGLPIRGVDVALLRPLGQDQPRRHSGARLRSVSLHQGRAGRGPPGLRGRRGVWGRAMAGRTGACAQAGDLPTGSHQTRVHTEGQRQVQAAGHLNLAGSGLHDSSDAGVEPIFEADLPSELYAYRPGRNALQAVVEVEELVFRGHPEVVDADLADYFGSIPHAELFPPDERGGNRHAQLRKF